ncbi:sterol desaturase family protein [Phenylobacterium sp.]|uniref:sterol desaturase family protein n=1 Tax=Phenylobacterium sp. TaxID=1871053 RepID=UPI0025F1F165|nr:sterol desaturase family protein [Phenylobacterium sp.]
MDKLFIDAARIWLLNIAIVLPVYVIFAGGVWFVLWVLLGRVLRPRKIREATPTPRQLRTEFLYSVRSVAIFATASIGVTLLARAGAYPLSDLAATWGPVWFWASLALMIVGQDAYIYWLHRWMHRSRWYRMLHRRHHLSHNPSPFTAYSFDLGEAVLMTAPFAILWPAIVPTPWAVSLLFLAHQIFRNTLLHAGYELTPARADGRPWFDWLTTSTHHDLHHGEAGYNYAAWFTWWDRWMGTEHPEYHVRYARAAGVAPARAPTA